MTAARTAPSTALTKREPSCAACRVLKAAAGLDDAFLAGVALAARGATLDLCAKHREAQGAIGLHLFGLAARAQTTVLPRLSSSHVSPSRKKRRRAWIAERS